MSAHEFRETIAELIAFIESTDTLSEKEKHDLLNIAQSLKQVSAESNTDYIEDEMIHRLQGISEQFEERHPDLTAFVARISNLLSNIGI